MVLASKACCCGAKNGASSPRHGDPAVVPPVVAEVQSQETHTPLLHNGDYASVDVGVNPYSGLDLRGDGQECVVGNCEQLPDSDNTDVAHQVEESHAASDSSSSTTSPDKVQAQPDVARLPNVPSVNKAPSIMRSISAVQVARCTSGALIWTLLSATVVTIVLAYVGAQHGQELFAAIDSEKVSEKVLEDVEARHPHRDYHNDQQLSIRDMVSDHAKVVTAAKQPAAGGGEELLSAAALVSSAAAMLESSTTNEPVYVGELRLGSGGVDALNASVRDVRSTDVGGSSVRARQGGVDAAVGVGVSHGPDDAHKLSPNLSSSHGHTGTSSSRIHALSHNDAMGTAAGVTGGTAATALALGLGLGIHAPTTTHAAVEQKTESGLKTYPSSVAPESADQAFDLGASSRMDAITPSTSKSQEARTRHSADMSTVASLPSSHKHTSPSPSMDRQSETTLTAALRVLMPQVDARSDRLAQKEKKANADSTRICHSWQLTAAFFAICALSGALALAFHQQQRRITKRGIMIDHSDLEAAELTPINQNRLEGETPAGVVRLESAAPLTGRVFQHKRKLSHRELLPIPTQPTLLTSGASTKSLPSKAEFQRLPLHDMAEPMTTPHCSCSHHAPRLPPAIPASIAMSTTLAEQGQVGLSPGSSLASGSSFMFNGCEVPKNDSQYSLMLQERKDSEYCVVCKGCRRQNRNCC